MGLWLGVGKAAFRDTEEGTEWFQVDPLGMAAVLQSLWAVKQAACGAQLRAGRSAAPAPAWPSALSLSLLGLRSAWVLQLNL